MKVGVSVGKNFDMNTAFCDDTNGFAFYGTAQLRNGNNSNGSSYGLRVKASGLIGILLNMDKGEISFFINGKN